MRRVWRSPAYPDWPDSSPVPFATDEPNTAILRLAAGCPAWVASIAGTLAITKALTTTDLTRMPLSGLPVRNHFNSA
jgi:hypothetical protein